MTNPRPYTDADDERARQELLSAVSADALEEAAVRVDREGWELLIAALEGSGPSAGELAEYARRRAAVWTRRAETEPRYAPYAANARRQRREADVRHVSAAAAELGLLPEPPERY